MLPVGGAWDLRRFRSGYAKWWVVGGGPSAAVPLGQPICHGWSKSARGACRGLRWLSKVPRLFSFARWSAIGASKDLAAVSQEKRTPCCGNVSTK